MDHQADGLSYGALSKYLDDTKTYAAYWIGTNAPIDSRAPAYPTGLVPVSYGFDRLARARALTYAAAALRQRGWTQGEFESAHGEICLERALEIGALEAVGYTCPTRAERDVQVVVYDYRLDFRYAQRPTNAQCDDARLIDDAIVADVHELLLRSPRRPKAMRLAQWNDHLASHRDQVLHLLQLTIDELTRTHARDREQAQATRATTAVKNMAQSVTNAAGWLAQLDLELSTMPPPLAVTPDPDPIPLGACVVTSVSV